MIAGALAMCYSSDRLPSSESTSASGGLGSSVGHLEVDGFTGDRSNGMTSRMGGTEGWGHLMRKMLTMAGRKERRI